MNNQSGAKSAFSQSLDSRIQLINFRPRPFGKGALTFPKKMSQSRIANLFSLSTVVLVRKLVGSVEASNHSYSQLFLRAMHLPQFNTG